MRYRFYSDEALLKRLFAAAPHAEAAWKEFLRRYSNLFLKVIWQFERDNDAVMDAYVYVCTALANHDFRKLRQYQPQRYTNPAKLSTWLTVVVKNLCLEYRRTRHGRRRFPKAVLALSAFEQQVFKLYYWQGYSVDEVTQHLGQQGNVREALDAIEALALRPSKNWTTHDPQVVAFDERLHGTDQAEDVDAWVAWFENAIRHLSTEEQQVVRLRYWEGLGAPEIARILALPQRRVYTILQRTLGKLRKQANTERVTPR